MNLAEARLMASEQSGGTSSDVIKNLVIHCLQAEQATGNLLDFGAGKGELLSRLHRTGQFDSLAGMDLFARPMTITPQIHWHQQDLNEAIELTNQFETIVCSETIEHLENPRHTFRSLNQLLKPGGLLVLTMPNQESIRSYVGLLLGGHFTHFLGTCYPAHITALLRLDLVRLCAEVGFSQPTFHFSQDGGIPKLTALSWQRLSLGLLKGRLFSDNVAMTARKPI